MTDPSLFTGRYDDSLCGALAGRGHDVTLMARPMRATDAIVPIGYSYAPRWFGWSERLRPVLGEGAAFRAMKAAGYALSAVAGRLPHADVVHVQWLPFAPADARWLARLRRQARRPALVHTVHNASAYHGDAGVQGRGYAVLLGQFDRLIVHGGGTRDALVAQGVDAGRIDIIPHPPMRLARADAAALAAVPEPRAPRILFFGTIRPYKGLDLLIDACLSLWRAGAVFELAVAGKPFLDIAPMIERVRAGGFGDRLILDLDFMKEERLDAHMARADIIAFPYRHIDSSGAFLSALHHGKAMVTTRVGMFADLAGVSLCPAEDAGALADVLKPLVQDADLRARAGRDALALLATRGSWDEAAQKTETAYHAACMARDADRGT